MPKPRPRTRKVPSITPIDIKNKEFKGSLFGGYNKEEVRRFLEQVANEVNNLIKLNKELEAQLTQMRVKLLEAEEMRTDYEKLQDRMLILEGEVEAYKKENEDLRARIEELEEQIAELKAQLEEKEAQIAELSSGTGTPDEIIDIAVSAAEKLKVKALEEMEKEFSNLPQSFKPMINKILNRIRKEILG